MSRAASDLLLRQRHHSAGKRLSSSPHAPWPALQLGAASRGICLGGGVQVVRQQSYFTDHGIVTNTGRWLSHQGLGVFFWSYWQMPAYDDFESRPIDTGPIAPSFPGMQPTYSACLSQTHTIHAPYTHRRKELALHESADASMYASSAPNKLVETPKKNIYR